MGSRTLYSRSGTNWLAVLISFVFVLIGVWMIFDGEWFGWLEIGFFGSGLIVLTVPKLLKFDRLHLGPEGFQRLPGFGHPRLAWSDVKRFFLTSDGQTVVYELFPEPGETSDKYYSDDPDEYFGHFPSSYGLSPQALLELLQRYKLALNAPA